jgi:hypothetical protein
VDQRQPTNRRPAQSIVDRSADLITERTTAASSRPLGDNVVTRFSCNAVVTETEVRSGVSLRAAAAPMGRRDQLNRLRGGVVHVGVRVRRSGEGGYDDKLPSIG